MTASLWAPLVAGSPIFALGYLAYLAGSPSHELYVEAAFAMLTYAWPASLWIGLPLHWLLRRWRWQGRLIYLSSGGTVALVCAGIAGAFDDATWEGPRALVIVLYGVVAGGYFRRCVMQR